MSYTFEQLISYTAVSFIIGMLIAYIIVRAIRVSRSSFDELKESLGATKNELDTQKAMVSKAIEDKNQLEIKLNNEQHINRIKDSKLMPDIY